MPFVELAEDTQYKVSARFTILKQVDSVLPCGLLAVVSLWKHLIGLYRFTTGKRTVISNLVYDWRK